MKNIVIAQFYTSNVRYGEYSEKINEEYCNEKGYSYFCEKDDSKIHAGLEGRAPTWYKPKLIREVLDTLNPEYVLFLDIDAIVSDPRQLVEDFINPDYDLTLAEDVGHHSVGNAGVLLFKNSDWTRDFLNAWWDSADTLTGADARSLEISEDNLNKVGYFKNALWHDQTCLTFLYEKNENFRNHINIISNRSFNHREYKEGNFIFHAFAYGLVPNRKLDVIYRERMKADVNLPKVNLIVYHIYCVNNYIELVKQQLDRLVKSGLYEWCDKLEVTCINTENDFEEIKELLKYLPKATLSTFVENNYEYEGIKKVWEYSQQYDGKVFYFHTKGVSNNYINLETKEKSEWKIKGIKWWKEIMEYFLIDKFKDCIEKLESYDQCGVTSVNRWWWGNFWWSNLDWIRVNGEPKQGSRWMFEDWLNYQRTPSHYEFYHFEFNPYYTVLPDDIYINVDSYKEAKIEVKSAFYGALGEQQDEGKPIKERAVIDVTDVVKQNLVQNNNRGFNLYVSNGLGEDPCYGVVKMIEVNFLINDIPCILATSEGQTLKFKI